MSKLPEIICLASYHGRGGAQNNAARLARQFRNRGYASSLIFLKEREPSVSFEGIDDVRVLSDIPGYRGIWDAGQRFLSLAREKKPRAIIGFFPVANAIGAIASSRVPGCSFVSSLRNPADRQNRFVTPLEKVTGSIAMTHGIVAVSHTVARSFESYPAAYRRKIRVVYNTTPDLPEVDETAMECRRALHLPSEVRLLGCLGRLHPQKNVGHAISVLAELSDRNAVLALAGEGPEEAGLREQAERLGIADRVIFLGSLSGADVTRFYRAVDLFLFPSIYEGFGLTPVEAMSQGCLVVCSDLEITREIAGDAAIIVPLDPTVWRQKIEDLLDKPEQIQDMRKKGYERAAFFGDHDAMADGYLRAAGIID